jgi:hypothetical protein
MLSGVVATRAGRTGESTSWQAVAVEQACGEPPSRSTVKVSVTVVLPDAGNVERMESGTLTRKLLEDREERELVGRKMLLAPLLTITAVVQIKFDPER